MAKGILKGKEKTKQVTLAVIAAACFSSGLSWLSSDTMASVAYLAANQPYVQTFKVYGTKGVSNLTEVELQNLSNQETAYIRLRYDAFGKGIWEYGATVKIEGRTSIFGTIAEKATRTK